MTIRTSRPFVGRRTELSVVAAAVAAARRGTPGIVRIAGAAGLGKTSLIAAALERAAPATVLRASGEESESTLPLGVVDQLTAGLPPAVLDRYPLVGDRRAGSADPTAVGGELLAALGAVGGEDPVLLVVDDLQWADDASVRALVFLLRRLRHDRLVALLGWRSPDPLGGPPGRGDRDDRWERLLDSAPGAYRLDLDGLAPAELSELAAVLGRPLGSTGTAERLHARTRGHPLHARTLLEDLPGNVLAATTTDVLPAPRSLDGAVLARLARVGPDARALVVAAAVLGETCALAVAATVARTVEPGVLEGPDAVADALDEAVVAGLLEERGVLGQVGFVHPLLRAAVHGDHPPARRRRLHRVAAGHVAGRAALAHRIAAAAGPDDELAADLERAAPGASALDAADLLRAAASLSSDPAARARRTCAAVGGLLAAGEVGRAGDAEPDVAAAPPGPVRDGLLGRLALLRGRFAAARPLLTAAAADDDHRARLTAAADLALLAALEGRPAEAVDRAGACLADPDGGSGVRRPAGFALVLGLAAQGRLAEAHAVLDVAAGTPGARTRGHADVLVARGLLAAAAGDDAVAEALLAEASDLARGGTRVRMATIAAGTLAAVRDRLGHADGLDAAELAVASARDAGQGFAEALVRGHAAQMHAVRGDVAAARAHLAVAAEVGAPWWGSVITHATAGALVGVVEDDPTAVLRALDPVLRPDVLALADGVGARAPRVLQAEALLRQGRLGDAAAALDLPPGSPPGAVDVDVARLRGLLCGARGDPAAARRALEDGLALGVEAPLATARLETELGRHLVEAGERRAGVDLLRRARDRLTALGAAPFLATCEALLHAAGLTPSRAEEALGLTPHEDAVVALVVRGLTNREVARELFVSPRTVAYHLSNVYAKLGVTSRAGLRDRAAAPAR
ncbi:AAA family ATPase [Actinomycetospora termitidis]|uniref:AAA family ATPase n=1 Tax=Actinomycetospora termitidis TaxID=3053470 RepID=A0ABT7M4B1_9PSEU|nr:AAA family ATPase [Actinomycetospora sp. Odt1-22]MDL5155505.1 AAA family ATPase [Actinomycetospora sp. Odt1-22]